MDDAQQYHLPVLLQEVVQLLPVNPAGTYVDATFGGGGHSRALLEKLNENGRLITFDQDEDAYANRLTDERVLFIPQNFRHLQRFLKLHNITAVDGILADLGVSSHQFDTPERGFSTRFEGELDMRMDQRQSLTAANLLQTYSEQKLQLLFQEYGEVTNAKTLAHTIFTQRRNMPLHTITEFKRMIHPVVKGNPAKYLAQVFQALRIAVNDEMGALKDLLTQSAAVIKPGGRLAVITFHSLEDRLVKNFIKLGSFDEVQYDEIYGTPTTPALFQSITKKPVTASEEELKNNSRSRSAKLRVAERLP
ncbi:16S rRNA (cytosine1402-N4)-methyltransferase [Chitinophaga costaii]|uniref:Ribosomal RNA small subunit methyltransferase H n=1 Tax=Chitinophaga costaii TaxID=1335309 RepID=A0A1C4BU58_9BACT|nr:16S rRNA (cytosine(1402)-N(4))-methyltransferase RsmH [Chitinophaga costaii]PUZ27467.1 16S rRNA (cytosine(1402)-N(4))-methyltransferase RsmH [Chitinophaga costaii]SCC10459.1 16S rRNA (cytosine1402-N4)-methyltransferase [Chitinophaga costaii]